TTGVPRSWDSNDRKEVRSNWGSAVGVAGSRLPPEVVGGWDPVGVVDREQAPMIRPRASVAARRPRDLDGVPLPITHSLSPGGRRLGGERGLLPSGAGPFPV